MMTVVMVSAFDSVKSSFLKDCLCKVEKILSKSKEKTNLKELWVDRWKNHFKSHIYPFVTKS